MGGGIGVYDGQWAPHHRADGLWSSWYAISEIMGFMVAESSEACCERNRNAHSWDLRGNSPAKMEST